MAIEAGRTGSGEALTAATRETIFDASLYSRTPDSNDNIHGPPVKGFELTATDQDLIVYIHGLNTVVDASDGTSTVVGEVVPAGTTIQRYAYEGRSGLINKVEVEPVATEGSVSWRPCMV